MSFSGSFRKSRSFGSRRRSSFGSRRRSYRKSRGYKKYGSRRRSYGRRKGYKNLRGLTSVMNAEGDVPYAVTKRHKALYTKWFKGHWAQSHGPTDKYTKENKREYLVKCIKHNAAKRYFELLSKGTNEKLQQILHEHHHRGAFHFPGSEGAGTGSSSSGDKRPRMDETPAPGGNTLAAAVMDTAERLFA